MDVEQFKKEMVELIKKGLDIMTASQICSLFLECLDIAFYEKYKEYDDYDSQKA